VSFIGSVAFEALLNATMLAIGLWCLPRAFRQRKNRAPVVAFVLLVGFGLCVNATGHTITGWQGGFHID
jgi:hypothetical protein